MFGVGFTELLVIGIAILIFVGPGKLPEVTKQLGKMFVKFKRVTNEVKSSFEDAVREVEKEVLAEEREKIKQLLIAKDSATTRPLQASSAEHLVEQPTLDVVPTHPDYGHAQDPTLGFPQETPEREKKISET